MQGICRSTHQKGKTNSGSMGNRVCNQKNRKYIGAKQNHKAHKDRGGIGDRSTSLIELIGVEKVSRQNFGYEGTYYVDENGELYDKDYVDTHKPIRTGVKFYEVTDWTYDERREMNIPTIRRIVMIRIRDTQLSLEL